MGVKARELGKSCVCIFLTDTEGIGYAVPAFGGKIIEALYKDASRR